jgi:VWFA-related protein
VVRDKEGKAVGSLKRDDFRIFDDGKSQSISTFSVEANLPARERARQSSTSGNLPIEKTFGVVPTHFFAYLFDDVHLQAGDLMQVRAAAKKHLEAGMGADDRAAVFTTSGDVTLEFTSDKSPLVQAMDRIKPALDGNAHCPYMNYYLAQRIVDEAGRDSTLPGASSSPALNGATDDVWECLFRRAEHLESQARQIAIDAARREIQTGDANARKALLTVQSAVRRLASVPGSRTLILISSGFHAGEDHAEQNSAINLSIGRNIIINTLDASGLYTAVTGDASDKGPSTLEAAHLEDPINRQGRLLQTNVMAELAEGTGGRFFHDNNDLLGGFNQLGAPPEFVYVLGFRPEILKQAGRYHQLKVQIAKAQGLTLQARRGYYESAGASDSEQLISQELQDALFSRQEVRNLPIKIAAGYLQKKDSGRELTVTTHLDASQIHFQKVGEKNVDSLTLVCGLFDLNGNYVQGKKQEISFQMGNDVLGQLTDGINVKTTFDVQPGPYLIRVVLRDSGNQLVSAVNGSGFIP